MANFSSWLGLTAQKLLWTSWSISADIDVARVHLRQLIFVTRIVWRSRKFLDEALTYGVGGGRIMFLTCLSVCAFVKCSILPQLTFEFSSFLIFVFPRFGSLKKVKVAHTRLPSVGFRSWSRFLAVILQVMWVINPAVGCHYIPPVRSYPRNH